MRHLFLDNDAVQKLAVIYLMDDAIALLGGPAPQTYLLPTFKYRWKKKAKVLPDDVVATVAALLTRSKELSSAPRPDLLLQLENVDGVDEGEAILFALAAEDNLALVATGDKRSIRALAQAASCAGIASALAGRIITIEQILLQLIALKGFAFVRERVLRCQDLGDTALRAAFGSREQATEEVWWTRSTTT